MAAFKKMMGKVRPVGESIRLKRCGGGGVHGDLEDKYRLVYRGSGTAALCDLINQLKLTKPSIADCPKVLLPAYGCPDLVTAVVAAGCKPVLVDTSEGAPFFDKELIAKLDTRNTLACIAVNFLGLSENIQALRHILPNGVYIIEDRAQAYPYNAEVQGDFFILSFGKGKPVSVLGGGAIGFPSYTHGNALPNMFDMVSNEGGYRIIAKILAYNILISPWVYSIIERIPYLRIGQTELKTLEKVTPINCVSKSLISKNVSLHIGRTEAMGRIANCYHRLFNQFGDIVKPLSKSADYHRFGEARYLRFPIVCADAGLRDKLLLTLNEAGVGASAMYGSALADIEGVREFVEIPCGFSAARRFADRLLTLPVHSGVSGAVIDTIERVVCHELQHVADIAHPMA